MMNKQYSQQKRRLTIAEKSGDPDKVIAEVERAVAEWRDWDYGWPDGWQRWSIAYEDAQFAKGEMFVAGIEGRS